MNFNRLLLSAFIFISACQPREVRWEALSTLDSLSLLLSGITKEGGAEERRFLMNRAQELIKEVRNSVPDHIVNRAEVDLLLKDLYSLESQIPQYHNLTVLERETIINSIPPIVSKLLIQAGVPHRCGATCNHKHNS